MSFRAMLTAIAGALLGGFLVLAGGAGLASAHSWDDHAVTLGHGPVYAPAAVAVRAPRKSAADLPSTEAWLRAQAEVAAIDLSPTAPAGSQPFHQDDSCCGTIACHAGVEPAPIRVTQLVGAGKKFDLPPIQPMARSDSGGIERPPRGESTL